MLVLYAACIYFVSAHNSFKIIIILLSIEPVDSSRCSNVTLSKYLLDNSPTNQLEVSQVADQSTRRNI